MTLTHLAVYSKTVSVYFLQKRFKGGPKNAKNNGKQEEMTESKAVYVTKHKIKDDQNLIYQLYRSERDNSPKQIDNRTNFSCQYDCKRDNEICTCKNVITVRKHQEIRYITGMPKQIYAYHGRSFTDIGVGSIKALQRRKVRRIYLPETDDRGVGSSDLSSYVFRRSRYPKLIAKSSYYDHKRTSSKCVGGILEYNIGCVINEKTSPIIQTKSGATSPKTSLELKNTEIGSNTIDKKMETIGTQFETDKEADKREPYAKAGETIAIESKPTKKVSEHTKKSKHSNEVIEHKKKPDVEKKKEVDKTYSSDSLVQHVHNLENPSDEKHSRTSFPDPMENKLEREYRKMFSTSKSKDSKASYDRPINEFKSASILRRRFEALRRGLVRKDDSKSSKKIDSVMLKTSTQDSSPTHKDASVTSDPPSLIGRSFSNSKKYSPVVHSVEQDKSKTPYNNEKCSAQWPQNSIESDCQGVKGMFKLWGKKFNFEEDAYGKRRQATPMPSYDAAKKSEKDVKLKIVTTPKKEGRKFFFFKKKSKDKNKDVYKSKTGKDVTAGRCEIRDGLTLKIGGTVSPKQRVSKIPEEDTEIIRKEWLRKFLTSTIESARSVNVRWNNSMYATSSSTVFELLDTVYKNTGVVMKSRSEITTEESSFYRSYTKHKVNFVQDIEAWMVPKTIPDKPTGQIPLRINSNKEIREGNIEFTISDQKWYIEKSEAFSHKIEVVLHSNTFNMPNSKKVSSEYLRIDIPNGFFDATSSNDSKRNQSSDEEVYKIVEYETNSEIGRSRKAIKDLEKGDHASNEIKVIVSLQDSKNLDSKIIETVIKRPPTHRDVVIQGSNVNVPKRCDVIGVGIITQRDVREFRKPILKINDELTDDDESDSVLQSNQKKCEFAESYLQEYYRHWTPLGMDLYSWCVSDSHLKSCSEKSVQSLQNQGDGSKSCPNIYDDFQAATIVSCETSSCSHCAYEDQCANATKGMTKKFFKKFQKKSSKPKKAKPESVKTAKRALPKDSLEVFKRRKLYAASNKSKWFCIETDCCKPVSVSSCESRGAQNTTLIECPHVDKNNISPRKKVCKKHVSMPDCEAMNNVLRQLSDKKPEGILQFKGAGCEACKRKGSKCPKHACIQPQPSCEIPQPPCKASCELMKNPPCDRPHSPSCHISSGSVSSSGTPVCPRPPKPSSCGPDYPPRCMPIQPPCMPPPCPAAMPPCIHSPQKHSPSASQRSCSPCNDSLCSRPDTTAPCEKSPKPPCKKNRKSPPCSKSSILSKKSISPCATPPPCQKPSPPCQKPSPPCQKPSPPCKTPSPPCQKPSPPCKKPSPPCQTPSPPCKNPSPPPCVKPSKMPWIRCRTPPCTKPSSPPSCKKSSPCSKPPTPPYCKKLPPCTKPSPPPCAKSSILPWRKTSAPCSKPPTPPCSKILPPTPCQKPSPCTQIKTRCSQPQPCPNTLSTTCNAIPPCDKSWFRPTPCKKILKPQPCKANPSGCCHSPSSCNLSNSVSPQSSHECLSPAQSQCGSPKKQQSPCGSTKQIQSPCGSQQKISEPPCVSPHNFIPGSKTGLSLTQCPTPPVKKPPKKSLCHLPPCEQVKNKSRCIISPWGNECTAEGNPCQDFPWPMNSQISNSPSATSCPPAEPKTSSQCIKKCSMKPAKPTCQAEPMYPADPCFPKPTRSPQPVCSPQRSICSLPKPTCSPPKQTCPPVKTCPPAPICPPKLTCTPEPRCPPRTGLFLKMKPSRKKTCDSDCSAWDSNETLQGVVKLCSHEQLTIRLKQQTPSTEEIREIRHPKNIKMQDEDGQTLYERRDYSCESRNAVLEDLYRDSKINRVSTPIAITNMTQCTDQTDFEGYKSDQSLANLIEIHLKLRITQGDKTTEINIGNENEGKQNTNTEIGKAPPEVLVVNNGAEDITEDSNSKNDINIKITVRNFKPKRKHIEIKQCNEDFSKKISEKFHTVSTGYSDVTVDPNEDHVFSIHRATIDLSSSVEKSKTQSKVSNEVPSKECTENEPDLTASSHSTEPRTDVTEDENVEGKSISSKKDSQSEKFEETNTNESELPDFNDTDEQDAALLGLNTSNECNVENVMLKHNSKEEKKVLLKKVFQKAGRTSKNKESVRQLREMLKIILTDSSDNEDVNATSNELVKDVTYASLKPNYFRDTDSMNNYYQLDSTLSSIKDCKPKALYNTGEHNSEDSKSSYSEGNDVTFQGCMCSKVAERLNQTKMNISCCCRQKLKQDEGTNCDLRNDEDLFLLNYRTAEYVDVETQNSKYLSSKVNSLNVSIHSKNKSFTTEDIKVVEKIEMTSPTVHKKVAKLFSHRKSLTKEYEMKKLYQNTALGISDDEKVIVLSEKPTKLSADVKSNWEHSKSGEKSDDCFQDIETDILQSYEAKKAVLEIYAEKTENGEHFVAKLPKFVYDRESEITRNYEQIATNSYKSVCRKNVVMMSVRR